MSRNVGSGGAPAAWMIKHHFTRFLIGEDARNTNMLIWHKELWLIDHGAALYFHHAWDDDYVAHSRTPFPMIKDHVLLPFAAKLEEADRLAAEH